MKIIVPMAGMGKRMRPHTLTIPKPLLPIAGKTIVERLVAGIAGVVNEQVDEVAFIIKPTFGAEIEANLKQIAANIGAEGTIHYQDEALGTAHAIYCAEPALRDKVIVAFADTLFEADFTLDTSVDGIIWTKKVENPEQYGVVQLDNDGVITKFVEKSPEFVSDLAIIGIYYFKDGENLRDEIKYLLDNNIIDRGEYQITDALENMKQKGKTLKSGTVNQWLDCGNKNVTVATNAAVLDLIKEKEQLVAADAAITNSVINEPCYIGSGAVIENAVVGPYVSVGAGTKIVDSIIRHSIVYNETRISGLVADNSMIGNHVVYNAPAQDLSVGDYTTVNK